MDRPDAIEVHVEFVFGDTQSSGHVITRCLELPGSAFQLTPESIIGGCPIQSLELPPRALHPGDSPRLDLLGFRLRIRSDCARFHRGQRVVVERIRIIHYEASTA
jgi:hypothetical protein